MKIIELNRFRPSVCLNVRQLLNPIFFEPVARHPDHKRQRGMRLKARALRQARKLKALGSTWVPELQGTVEPCLRAYQQEAVDLLCGSASGRLIYAFGTLVKANWCKTTSSSEVARRSGHER